ncbi:MAG: TRAP transporter large permease, partial [Alphaproteobacteria bacterium]|nr:TRAP transporter large permease [Alphaproteobacteria bacterium]
MSLAFLVLVAVFFGTAAIGVPVGFGMLLGGIAYLLVGGHDLALAGEQILNGLLSSYVLLAVPMFILAANVMNAGTISDRLFAFAHVLVGRMRGGLAQVDIIVSIIFASMSGSAIADAAGPGLMTIRMMEKAGYPRGFAAAVVAASATVGPIIPPSIPMVLYALISGVSVGALFLGGVIPGLVMSAAMMIVVYITARRRLFPVDEPVPRHEWPRIIGRALLPLSLPMVLLGGIYSGGFTPTEAAAMGAAYAMILAGFVYRSLGPRTLYAVFAESLRSSAVVTLIICGAFVVNYAVATEQLPLRLAAYLDGIDFPATAFLLLLNLLFLVLGCFLDATTMLLVIVPLLLPTMKVLGIDLVHF